MFFSSFDSKVFQLPKIVHCLNRVNSAYMVLQQICYRNVLYKESMFYACDIYNMVYLIAA